MLRRWGWSRMGHPSRSFADHALSAPFGVLPQRAAAKLNPKPSDLFDKQTPILATGKNSLLNKLVLDLKGGLHGTILWNV